MMTLDHISDRLETIFELKFDADANPDPGSGFFFNPGSGIRVFYRGSGIRDGKNSDPGSGINIPDPQH
jgi:hypothetical protein